MTTPRPHRQSTASRRTSRLAADPWARDPRRPILWSALDRAPLHEVRRDHLERLRSLGALTHVTDSPDNDAADGTSVRGPRTVDVARSIEVDLLHAETLGWEPVSASAWRSLAYLDEALSPDGRRFRHRRGRDGWGTDAGDTDFSPEEIQGRVVLALGEACARGPDREFRSAAAALFRRSIPGSRGLTELRAIAAAILGSEGARRGGVDEATRLERSLVPVLAARFEPVAWSLDWPWPEPVVAAEGALPARALIVAGRRVADRRMVEMGLAVLDWLVRSAVTPDGHLSPVGDAGWWTSEGERATFDQMPAEPLSILLAAKTAFLATDDQHHLADMERAYGWYLGANDLGVEVADPDRGGCRDGLGPDGAHLHQGAASTVAWLTAVEHIRDSRRRWPVAA